MAKDKKSFILYADLIKSIEHLTNEEKGILFNHLLLYVNDKNPILEDRLILTAWKPIELQLKRDLIKFEEVKIKRSEAGKRSAELRALKNDEQNLTNSTSVDFDEQSSTNPTVNDTVNVTVNDNDNVNDTVNVILLKKETKNKIFSFRQNLINYGFDENLIDDWLKVRKNKKASNTETAYKKFISEIEKRNCVPNDVLEIIVANSWSGFNWEWIDNLKNVNNGKQQRTVTDIALDAFNSEAAKNFSFKPKIDY
jgi:hypothetical protein